MERALDALSPRFKPLAIELLARCVEAGIPVMVIQTRRTVAEHEANVAAGVSWTKHSKHIDGDAIDICPFEQFQLHGADKLQWDVNDTVWAKMADIGRKLGLRCGFDWKQKDAGHFEWSASATAYAPDETRKA